MASGGLGNLTVDLLLETAQWASALTKAEYQAQKTADAIEEKFNKLTGRVTEMFKGMAAGVIAGLSVGAFVKFVDDAQKAADSMDELAQRAGMSTASLAELSVYANISGTSIEALTGGMVKFNKAVIEAQTDPKSNPAEIFKSLGIELKNADGSFKSSQQLYEEFGKALGGMKDGATKTALAVGVLGKSGAEAIPVFNSMFQSTEELTAASKRYGAEVEKLAPIAGALEEQMALMHTNSKLMATLLAEQLIPYFTELVKQWNNASSSGSELSQFVTVLLNAFKGLAISVDAVVTVLTNLATMAVTAIKAMAYAMSGQWGNAAAALTDGLKSLGEQNANFEKRLNALLLPMDQTTKALKQQTDATDEQRNAAAKAAAAAEKAARAAEKAEKERARRQKEFNAAWVKSIDAQIDMERDLALATAKNADEREKVEKKALKEQSAAWVKFIDETIELEKDAALASAKIADEKFKKQVQMWDGFIREVEGGLHNAFIGIFDSTSGGWSKMLEQMRTNFKRILLDYIWTSFAKPQIMNFMADLGGAIGEAATKQGGVAGQGGMLSKFLGGGDGWLANLLNGKTQGGEWYNSNQYGAVGIAGAGAAGGLFGNLASGALGAGQRGQSNATSYAATGAAVGMQVYGPIGAAIGAVIGLIAGYTSDPDPDAMRSAKFGAPKSDTPSLWRGSSKLGQFGFTEGKWLSDSDMGDQVTKFLAGVKAMDNALVGFMTPEQIEKVKARLAAASKEYELGMEHGEVTNLGQIMVDRLAIITSEIDKGLSDFVAGFQGPVEDIIALVNAYIEATRGMGTDIEALIEAAQPKTMMETYQAGIKSFTEYIAGVDTTAESLNGLTKNMADFEQATVNMVLAIDAVTASIHEMFMSTADNIRQSLMTEEERYKFLQDRADKLFAELLTETDPAKIQSLSEQINSDINTAWGMLDSTQQQALGDKYLARLDMVDQTVADKLHGLRDVVVDDAQDLMDSVTTKLETLFGKGEESADKNLQAANAMGQAAATLAKGIPVYVDTAAVTGS